MDGERRGRAGARLPRLGRARGGLVRRPGASWACAARACRGTASRSSTAPTRSRGCWRTRCGAGGIPYVDRGRRAVLRAQGDQGHARVPAADGQPGRRRGVPARHRRARARHRARRRWRASTRWPRARAARCWRWPRRRRPTCAARPRRSAARTSPRSSARLAARARATWPLPAFIDLVLEPDRLPRGAQAGALAGGGGAAREPGGADRRRRGLHARRGRRRRSRASSTASRSSATSTS